MKVLHADKGKRIVLARHGRQDYGPRNLSGPIIYDALHAEGARKAGASVVNAYNPDHFKKVAPDLTMA